MEINVRVTTHLLKKQDCFNQYIESRLEKKKVSDQQRIPKGSMEI